MDKTMYQTKCTKLDVYWLSKSLAMADYMELKASGALEAGEEVEGCLKRCVAASKKTYAIRCELTDLPLAIGGYTECGNCWFLSSKILGELPKEERKEFRAQLMENLLETLKLFPVIKNVAWKRNEQHLGLIKSCGGHLMQEIRLGDNQPFVYFEFRREDFPQLKEV